jgi:hypothetical protein
VSSSFDRFLIEESPRMPWGATLVLITPFTNPIIAAAVLRLRDSGRRLVLIGLGKASPPFISGVITYHIPIQEEEPVLPPEDGQEPEPEEEQVDLYANLTPRQRYLLRREREEADHVK